MTSNWSWPKNKKKGQYISKHWSDPLQILKLSTGDETKIYIQFKWTLPPMIDDLKIEKCNISWGNLIGKGNIECGSVQSSMFIK
jgi:hypothetical protein